MSTLHIPALAAAALLALVPARASEIEVTTAYSTAPAQPTAQAYLAVVNVAAQTPHAGYGTTTIALYDNVSNHRLFGGPVTDIGFKSVIDFVVAPDNAGEWAFRAGVDFGRGGAMLLDGAVLDFNASNVWWGGSFADLGSYLHGLATVEPGAHQLVLVGLEECCDGGQQAQFSVAGGPYRTFGSADGLSPVPEPAAYAMLLAGLARLAARARRR